MITLKLEKNETSTINLQKIVTDLGNKVKFTPNWATSDRNIFADRITKDKEYDVLGLSKRYEPPSNSIVNGVLVTIIGDDDKEIVYSHDWFLDNSSDYEIDN